MKDNQPSATELDEALALRALEILETDPSKTQRALAQELGISLGKTNYCLRALIDKGLVKFQNFKDNPHKFGYAYLLTPAGLEEKARMTLNFLRKKEKEYQLLQVEIADLRARVAAAQSDKSSPLQ